MLVLLSDSFNDELSIVQLNILRLSLSISSLPVVA